MFLDEENVNEFLDEVLGSPLTQTRTLDPPLIEVLQVTDEKIQIHAKVLFRWGLKGSDYWPNYFSS